MEDQLNSFSETQHALLFASIAKAVMERTSVQQGEALMRKAVRQYGAERGRRMAIRAQANGHARNMTNFLAYSEYRAVSKEMTQELLEKVPDVRACISHCSWFATWQKHGLLPYGRLYCLEIDEAVARGFNPDLKIDVIKTQSNGAEQCEFVFHSANLTFINSLAVAYKKTFRPGKQAVLPWEYHVGHLFSTLEKVIVEELGETGRAAIEAGLAEFEQHYGKQAAQVVLAGRGVDYTRVPPAGKPNAT